MNDYKTLVEALRRCDMRQGCFNANCRYSVGKYFCDMDKVHKDAADAIEALQAQLLKRGEIVRCRECRWGHLCVIGQHLGLDGFCSKGEREVQDG